MRLRLFAPLLLTAALALSGCFQMHLLLRLDEDGSGTIEETVLLSNMIVSMMESFADSTGTSSLIDEARLIARADSFGPGVRFLRADSIAEGGMQGYRAVYAFDDVNTIRLRDDPQALDMGGDSGGETKGLGLVTTFAYTPGELRIRSPHEGVESVEPIDPDVLAAKTDSIRQSMQETGPLLRGMLGNASLSYTVTLPGPITETDAQFATDSTVTMAHIDFGAYLDLMEENPELAARLDLTTTDAERRALLRQLEDRDGLQFEPAEEVVVRFSQ